MSLSDGKNRGEGAHRDAEGVTSVRDDAATMMCLVCGRPFVRFGRRRYCSTACRQAAWRLRNMALVEPLVAKADTVYHCPSCDARFLGEQRCEECNTWARRVGPGGLCPSCDEPVAVTELLGPEHFAPRPATTKTTRAKRPSSSGAPMVPAMTGSLEVPPR